MPIFSLFGAEVISSVGNNITTLAVPWFLLVTTGSPVRTGLTGAAMGIGSALASVLGGPLGGPARVQAGQSAGDLACAAIVAAIPLLYLASVFSFWQMLVLVFVLSCINMLGDSARYALIPGLAARERMPIERARPTGRSPTSPRWWVRSWPACRSRCLARGSAVGAGWGIVTGAMVRVRPGGRAVVCRNRL